MAKRAVLFFSLVGLVVGLSLLNRCTSPTKTLDEAHTYLNLSDTVSYVGSQTCKGCHVEIYQSFMQTGMGQSFGPPTKAKSSGQFENNVLYDSFSNFHYQPFWKGDSLYLKEFRLKDGDTVFTRKEKVHYIVGSGQHTNSHITQANGYLHQMPFTYYTQKDILNLPPGFEKGNNTRFSRSLGMECISCHNAYPDHVEGSFNKFDQVPKGIDCERCHGPGQAHVEAKRRGELVDVSKEIDYSIVNPGKLAYDKQIDLCQRCHLQGNAILNDGKEWDDFKPGMNLNEVANVFMPTLKDQKGEFVMAAHPDRLRQSQCFISSQQNSDLQAMTCISCHNPHQSVKETQIGYFNTKCQSCHEVESVEKCSSPLTTINCIDCHMKKSGTVDIPHVSVTDHFIRVYGEEEDVHSIEQEVNGLICLTQKNPDHKLVAKAYLNFYEKFDQKPLFIDSAKYYLSFDKDKQWHKLWIQLHFLTGNNDSLRAIARKVKAEELDAQSLYQLSTGFKRTGGNADERERWLRKAIEKMPLLLAYRNELAIHLLEKGDMQGAEEELTFILSEFSEDESALNSYGFYFLIKGDLDAANTYFQKLLSLNPDHENGLLNSAKILIAQGNLDKAKELLERVQQAHPESNGARLILQQLK